MNRLWIVIVSVILGGCAQQMSYTPTTSYAEDEFRHVTDEDILRAFDAEPQLRLPTSIAWYNMGRDSIMTMVQYTDSATIAQHYTIPKALVEGVPPLLEAPYGYGYRMSEPINFNAVRLLAARAKCDLIILVTSQFAEQRELNGWAFANLFLVPALVTPYLNATYKYAGEMFVFDVRNGYMYRHIKYTDTQTLHELTIWEAEGMAKKQNQAMMQAASAYMQSELRALLAKAA